MSGEIIIYNPTSGDVGGTFPPLSTHTLRHNNSDNNFTMLDGGSGCGTAGLLTGFRFTLSSGTFDKGRIRVYGQIMRNTNFD